MLLDVILVFLILICLALGAVVLLQQSEGGALGLGGGPSGFMTSRGAGDLLTRTTWILAGVFFALCLGLTILQGRLHRGGSVVDRLRIDPLSADVLNTPRPAPATPVAPSSAPGGPTGFEAPAPRVNGAPLVAPPVLGASSPTGVAGTPGSPPSASRPSTAKSVRAASASDTVSTSSGPAPATRKP